MHLMFFTSDPFLTTLFAAAAIFGLLFMILHYLRMPADFTDNQLQRNEIRKQIIRNEIVLSDEMKQEETTQVS